MEKEAKMSSFKGTSGKLEEKRTALAGLRNNPSGLKRKAIFSGETLWKEPRMNGGWSKLAAKEWYLAAAVGALCLPYGTPWFPVLTANTGDRGLRAGAPWTRRSWPSDQMRESWDSLKRK
jgi:hypothetical protein